ncbi:MAG: hypothetical protein PUE01_10015 [Clostridiaceae bacterium]|nr:hypothetical protein [Clostridiaceae bacterium]
MICFIDYRCSKEEIKSLEKLSLNPIKVPKCNNLYEAINGHVDIQLHIIDTNHIMVQKDISIDFLNELKINEINYSFSNNNLTSSYPQDIILNAYSNANLFVHNLSYTDKNLLRLQKNKKKIHVKQGYTKCSILPVNENAIITSDKSIYNALTKENMDVLLIPPADILLPSLNYGFIGGTGGLISENKIAFFGELKNYAYGKEVYNFLYKYDIEPVSLRKGKLIDRGSLFIL